MHTRHFIDGCGNRSARLTHQVQGPEQLVSSPGSSPQKNLATRQCPIHDTHRPYGSSPAAAVQPHAGSLPGRIGEPVAGGVTVNQTW